MKVYLAGPMRGIPQFNFPAFKDATARLRADGYTVFSPAERDIEAGFDPIDMDGNENLAEHGFDLREALGADLAWITEHAHTVAVLPGWENSKGVAAEVATARALGLRVMRYTGGVDEPVLVPVDLPSESGEVRTTSATGGEKGRKPLEVGAIDPLARAELGKVAAFGSAKYSRGNYLLGYDWSLCVDAMHRHMLAFESGEDRDPESGLLHTAHAAWHGLALCSFLLREVGTDDRTVA